MSDEQECGAVYGYVPLSEPRIYTNTVSVPTRCKLPAGHKGLMHRSGETSWPTAVMLADAARDPHRTGWGTPGVKQRSFR